MGDHKPNSTDADLPMEHIDPIVPNVAEGQVDKSSGTLIDPVVSPMGSGILGAPAQGGGDIDEANAWAAEETVPEGGADDPDDLRA